MSLIVARKYLERAQVEWQSYALEVGRDLARFRLLNAIASDNLNENIARALRTLSPREEKILDSRFGISTGEPKTLEAVGREFGVTRERIRSLESTAIRKLRHPSRRVLLLGFK